MSDPSLTILYDGWSLVRAPDSPACLHLLAILASLPPEVEPVIALPAPAPSWLQGYSTVIERIADTPQGQLAWEQRHLPRIGRAKSASLIHYLTLTAPLFGSRKAVVSPSGLGGHEHPEELSFAGRLLASIREGGLTRSQAVFWPEGIPVASQSEEAYTDKLVYLPQLVHPGFFQAPGPTNSNGNGTKENERSILALDLPETFVLFHGPGRAVTLTRLLKAWSWAAGAIGDYYPLLVLGLDEAGKRLLSSLAAAYSLEDSVRALPPVTPDQVPAIFRSCSALFHPAPVPAWGGAVQHALACGKPVVGVEDERMNALVGPAAYLTPAEDSRALGAALLTAIVEEQVAERLSAAALERVSNWGSEKFGERLLAAYRDLL